VGAGKHYRVAVALVWSPPVARENPKLLADDAVEAAITRVLAAEASARDAVARARGEAMEIAERAREKARRLGLSTDRRIRVLHAAFDAKVTAKVAALDAQAAALGTAHDLTPAEAASVERAVAELAGALTGGPP
jgi:vacuolar-type H+-ATPase subunit H